MANCNNCVHYPVCDLLRSNGERDAASFQLSGCDHFKERSRFVELPCKIGDTVYSVVQCDDGLSIYEIEVGHISVSLSILDDFPPYAVGKVKPDGGGFIFDLEEIGKTVFLTRAEAKKALAERRDGNASV